MKKYLISFLVITSTVLHGQNLKKKLRKIQTNDQAYEYAKTHKNVYLTGFNALEDTSVFDKKILSALKGDILTREKSAYKVMDFFSMTFMRASYIYLDGTKYSLTQIDSIRSIIIQKYNQGTPFTDLVKQYNMDGNLTGDLGWFDHGKLVEPFWNAVAIHSKGDIFTVDVFEKDWYYVTIKTADDRQVKAVKVVRLDEE